MSEHFSEEWISAYLDGELSDKEASHVEEVLARDPKQARLLEELSAMRSSLKAQPVIQPPAELTRNIMLSVAKKQAEQNRSSSNVSEFEPLVGADSLMESEPAKVATPIELNREKADPKANWRIALGLILAVSAMLCLPLFMSSRIGTPSQLADAPEVEEALAELESASRDLDSFEAEGGANEEVKLESPSFEGPAGDDEASEEESGIRFSKSAGDLSDLDRSMLNNGGLRSNTLSKEDANSQGSLGALGGGGFGRGRGGVAGDQPPESVAPSGRYVGPATERGIPAPNSIGQAPNESPGAMARETQANRALEFEGPRNSGTTATQESASANGDNASKNESEQGDLAGRGRRVSGLPRHEIQSHSAAESATTESSQGAPLASDNANKVEAANDGYPGGGGMRSPGSPNSGAGSAAAGGRSFQIRPIQMNQASPENAAGGTGTIPNRGGIGGGGGGLVQPKLEDQMMDLSDASGRPMAEPLLSMRQSQLPSRRSAGARGTTSLLLVVEPATQSTLGIRLAEKKNVESRSGQTGGDPGFDGASLGNAEEGTTGSESLDDSTAVMGGIQERSESGGMTGAADTTPNADSSFTSGEANLSRVVRSDFLGESGFRIDRSSSEQGVILIPASQLKINRVFQLPVELLEEQLERGLQENVADYRMRISQRSGNFNARSEFSESRNPTRELDELPESSNRSSRPEDQMARENSLDRTASNLGSEKDLVGRAESKTQDKQDAFGTMGLSAANPNYSDNTFPVEQGEPLADLEIYEVVGTTEAVNGLIREISQNGADLSLYFQQTNRLQPQTWRRKTRGGESVATTDAFNRDDLGSERFFEGGLFAVDEIEWIEAAQVLGFGIDGDEDNQVEDSLSLSSLDNFILPLGRLERVNSSPSGTGSVSRIEGLNRAPEQHDEAEGRVASRHQRGMNANSTAGSQGDSSQANVAQSNAAQGDAATQSMNTDSEQSGELAQDLRRSQEPDSEQSFSIDGREVQSVAESEDGLAELDESSLIPQLRRNGMVRLTLVVKRPRYDSGEAGRTRGQPSAIEDRSRMRMAPIQNVRPPKPDDSKR